MLEELVHRVEASLLRFGRSLFERRQQADPTPPTVAKAEEAPVKESPAEELARRRAELERFQAEQGMVSQRLAGRQETAALLPSQVESSLRRGKSSQAVLEALELEQIRKDIAHDQETVARLEQLCWSIGFRIRQLERQLEKDTARKGKGSSKREEEGPGKKRTSRPQGPARPR